MQNGLLYSRAYWVAESLIAWDVDVGNGFSCYLLASKNASLTIANCQIQGLDFSQLLLLVQVCGVEKFHCCLFTIDYKWQWTLTQWIVKWQLTGEDLKIKLQEDRVGLPANVIFRIFLNVKRPANCFIILLFFTITYSGIMITYECKLCVVRWWRNFPIFEVTKFSACHLLWMLSLFLNSS